LGQRLAEPHLARHFRERGEILPRTRASHHGDDHFSMIRNVDLAHETMKGTPREASLALDFVRHPPQHFIVIPEINTPSREGTDRSVLLRQRPNDESILPRMLHDEGKIVSGGVLKAGMRQAARVGKTRRVRAQAPGLGVHEAGETRLGPRRGDGQGVRRVIGR
jgi:hypothetical protein